MGGVLTLVSIVAGTASFIALFKPLPSIGLPTRQRAFGIWFASWVMLLIGLPLVPESTSPPAPPRVAAQQEVRRAIESERVR